MSINNEYFEFRKVASEVNEYLNYYLESTCRNCGNKIKADIFTIVMAKCQDPEVIEQRVDLKCDQCGAVVEDKFQLGDIQSYPGKGFYIRFGEKDYCFPKYLQFFIDGFYESAEYFTDTAFFNYSPLAGNLSMAIIRLFIALEGFFAFITKKRMKQLGYSDNEIFEELVLNKPNVYQYRKLMEFFGIRYNKQNFDDISSCQRIRNKIVHKGYSANINDFLLCFKTIGKIISS